MIYNDKKKISPLRIILVVLGCAVVNFTGRLIATGLQLPLWLDSVGTVFAAYVLGPISGAIVGCTENIIYAFWNPHSIAYSITSISIGLGVGLAARRKNFETFFGTASVVGGITIISMFISSILTMVCFDFDIGNIWGNGVRDYLLERGLHMIASTMIGELYIDFLDKLVTVFLIYFLIKIYRAIRRRRILKKHAEMIIGLMLVICVGAAAPTSPVSADTAPVSSESAATTETTAPASSETVTAPAPETMGTDYTASAVQSSTESVSSSFKSPAPSETTFIKRIYNASNGLECGHANDIAITNDGILWIGSYSGLYRYNGSEFRFMSEYEDIKNVNCLYTDEEGRLWIGTNDSGITITINESITGVLNSETGLPSDSVRSIVQCSDGDYYIGTSDSMAVVQRKLGVMVSKTISEVCFAKSLSADKHGNVAAVTSDGKLYIIRNGEVAFLIPEVEPEVQYSACSFDENGFLYVGTTDGRVVAYSVQESSAIKFLTDKCGNLSVINQIYFHDKTTWILADNGIGRFVDRTFRKVETLDFTSSIQNMAIDYQGNPWFASSRHGLMQLSKSAFTNIFSEYGIDADVANTTAIRDGYLYMGADSGLSIIRLVDGMIIENELTELLRGSRVRCIMFDSKGSLWFCTYGVGLIKYDISENIVDYGSSDYGIGTRVRVARELSDGSIAVSSGNGLTYIRDGKAPVNIPFGGDLGSSGILTLCESGDGRLLLGTDGNGIIAVKGQKVLEHIEKSESLRSGVILRLVLDPTDGGIFIVTSNGICRMYDGTITPLEFPYSNNYDLYLDDDGEVFVLGSAGIYVVDREGLINGNITKNILLNSKVGLTASLTANARNALTPSKDLYLSTDKGVFKMNLDDYLSSSRSYRLQVREVIINDTPTLIERGTPIPVSRDTDSIVFIPEVINYSLEQPRISYYLEGYDDGYISVAQSELGSVVYNNLPSGSYTFHLAIFDDSGKEILEESSYKVTKEVSIQDNGWFTIYMIIVGGLFVAWLTWFLTRVGVQRTIVLQKEKLAMALSQVKMGNETILAIAKTVDAKDVLTSKHSQRVSEYSVMIASEYGFSTNEQENLRKAALLHDIGKIGIPDSILKKAGRLTDDEYAIMKTHVTLGADILKDFTLVDHVVEGARYHHERYDGTGYPDGLKGIEIPLYGRIIAIADAFDAMTANRVYRDRQPMEYVMGQLRGGRGTQFDPELIDIFINIIERGDIDIDALYNENNKHEHSGNVPKAESKLAAYKQLKGSTL
ncbi:MAG: HD domain-containing protein [Lachnospiraceae bacterium]|nr:HD domain-containing protein [Lachnospiraceae bacterium]